MLKRFRLEDLKDWAKELKGQRCMLGLDHAKSSKQNFEINSKFDR